VAWMDEDSVTMPSPRHKIVCKVLIVRASTLCLFATTTYAFAEKQGAAIIAKAFEPERRRAHGRYFTQHRSGSIALQSAIDAVKAGSAQRVLVIAGRCRMGAPGSGF